MTTINEVPLIASPQTLSVSMSGQTYNLRVTWNVPGQCWLLDVADALGTPLLTGLPLVTGANMLGQFAYVGLAGVLYVGTDGAPDEPPTFTNLGTQGHLYYATQP
jgi:hypothetical protein